MAYGVLIPQNDCLVKNWADELSQNKNFTFGTLEDKQLKISSFSDFKLFEDVVVCSTHIPCALLLNTSLDLDQKRDYGFGYTTFPLFKGMEIFDNVLSRNFLFCLGGLEESFNGEDVSNWTQYINTDKLMSIAKRLF